MSLIAGLAQAQTKPLVVFVQDNSLRMASVTNPGAEGLGQLASIFTAMGARTVLLGLNQPFPADTQLIVLVGPEREVSGEALARIWSSLEEGSSFLLALDPPGQEGNTDTEGGGVDRLLSSEYGVNLLDGLLVNPGFTNQTIGDPSRTMVTAQADALPNPITAPLATYNLPVFLWGARNLRAETLGLDGSATPLLDSSPEYAETDDRVFRDTDPDPLELNIGVDYQGKLVVATSAENVVNHSRIAVLGDSQIFENGFGLKIDPATQTPRYPGDYVLVQRLASWLLRQPETSWPSLPDNMTWINLDGSGGDWPSFAHATNNPNNGASVMQVRAFRNSAYLYLLIETAQPPDPDSHLTIEVDSNSDGQVDRKITIDAHSASYMATNGTAVPLPDAVLAVGQTIEARIPLRATGPIAQVDNLCLSNGSLTSNAASDCLQSIGVYHSAQQDPAYLRLTGNMLGTVNGPRGANVRATPDATGQILAVAPPGDLFAVLGRNEDGTWVEVENGPSSGWISALTITLSGDLQLLPIVQP